MEPFDNKSILKQRADLPEPQRIAPAYAKSDLAASILLQVALSRHQATPFQSLTNILYYLLR